MDVGAEALVAAVAIVVSVIIYARTTVRERAVRRAELVRTYSTDLSQDQSLMDLFTDIDYERFRFVDSEDSWLGKRPEQDLVRLLDLFNSVGHNWQQKVVRLDDIHGTTLGYAILRAYEDEGVQAYLGHVAIWDADHLGTGVPFEFFQRLARALCERSASFRDANGLLQRRQPTIVTLAVCCLPAAVGHLRAHVRAHAHPAADISRT
jgi:hypothetical protein